MKTCLIYIILAFLLIISGCGEAPKPTLAFACYPMDPAILDHINDYDWSFQLYSVNKGRKFHAVIGMNKSAGYDEKQFGCEASYLNNHEMRSLDFSDSKPMIDLLKYIGEHRDIFCDHSEYQAVEPGKYQLPPDTDTYFSLSAYARSLDVPENTVTFVKGMNEKVPVDPSVSYVFQELNRMAVQTLENGEVAKVSM
jgi:hypothetical protein